MVEPRKIFRIERTALPCLEEPADTASGERGNAEIMHELRALRSALAAMAATTPSRPAAAVRAGDVSRLTSTLNLIAGAIAGDNAERAETNVGDGADAQLSRIDHELAAIVKGSEQATEKILAAAEEVDSTANTLSAALDGRIEQELVQDIQDLVVKIFEACNFQDLIGQRVGKVSAAIRFVEDHVTRVLNEIKTASATARQDDGHALHGPQLDGDSGHATQNDIDALFASRR
ncbi:MAG: protein phosphatase CheZ [Xanthobacteraceae bacterium]